MECNREDALRAKEIAERKFIANDIGGAKKFALKAQNLYPSLEGINQMIATLDVHLSSSAIFAGEKDWYAILCINPKADDETVKKQYRKLALLLHPDKNKSVGSEASFQLISEAWSVLSDKTKRMLYDQKRFDEKKHHSVAKTSSNGFYNSATKVQTQKRKNESAPTSSCSKSNPPSSLPESKVGTFWTSCNACKMQYEYLRAYLNLSLLCPNCQKSFVASENRAPVKQPNPSASKLFQRHHQQNPNRRSTTKNANVNVVSTFSTVEREEALVRRRRSGMKRNSKMDGNEHSLPNVEKHGKRRKGMADDTKVSKGGGGMGNDAMHPGYFSKSSLSSRKFSIMRGFSQDHLFSTLVSKSNVEVHNTIEAWISAREAKFADEKENAKKQNLKYSVKEKVKETVCEKDTDKDREDEARNSNVQAPPSPKKEESNSKNTEFDNEVIEEPVSMDVPDPDFYDFDKDRTEKSFQGDEIWATYDDEDGMPRYYVSVQKVLSFKPFKICVGFLNSKSNSEFGPLNWVASGFAKTSGEFRVGKYEVKSTLNIFSHRVRWEKARGVFKILPRKGEIWAIYKNWSPAWNEHTPDDLIYKYDMVEVLDNYNEEQGVSVSPLLKVAGFKTVFRRDLDLTKVIKIPREEMFRFSHQVPSFVLTGEEGPNAPKGCYELDPAATPLELLQIVTETKDEGVLKASEQ